jgi:inner membrane protein
MDSLTQIVLGAAVGEAVLGKKVGNKAMLWGAIAGTIPDLDVLFKLFLDAVTSNELHRGFSHSLLFSLLMAPLLGGFTYRLYQKKKATWKGWSQLFFWALFTHPLLDAHTTWGTQLLWPLDLRVSFKNIFVIDPLYTLPFLFFLLWTMCTTRGTVKRARRNRLGLVVSSLYMVLTLVFKLWTFQIFQKSLKEQSIAYLEIQTKPTPMNSMLWSATVATENAYLIGYTSLFDRSTKVKFVRFEKKHELLGRLKNHKLVKRLIRLSQGWYTIEKRDGRLFFNDLRFGLMGIKEGTSRFVFSYELYFENGELKAKEAPKEYGEIKPVLRALVNRIRGN